jgi:hypothetical protein
LRPDSSAGGRLAAKTSAMGGTDQAVKPDFRHRRDQVRRMTQHVEIADEKQGDECRGAGDLEQQVPLQSREPGRAAHPSRGAGQAGRLRWMIASRASLIEQLGQKSSIPPSGSAADRRRRWRSGRRWGCAGRRRASASRMHAVAARPSNWASACHQDQVVTLGSAGIHRRLTVSTMTKP